MPDIQIVELDPKLSVDGTEVIEIQDAAGGLGSSFKTPLSNLIGPEGPPGDPGADGSDATATAGTTTTLAPGSDATVSNSGTPSDAVFDFGIPEGLKGDPGDPGADGNDGTSATVDAGTTTTGAPGSNANVTNSGTPSDAVFDFTIPAGLPGADGEDGSDGVGIPVAGGTGQVLIKASAADYDTEWSNPAGGGDVTGPDTSQDNHLAVWSGTTGELLQDSSKDVDDVVINSGAAVSANFAAFNGGSGKVIQDAGVGSSSFVANSWLSTITSALQPNDDITELNNNAGYKAYYSGATLPTDTSPYDEGDLFCVTT